MSINFALLNATNALHYAARHHVCTRATAWTDAEFDQGRSTFAGWMHRDDNSESFIEDALNWQKESIRRGVLNGMNGGTASNHFAFAVRDFNQNADVGELRMFNRETDVPEIGVMREVVITGREFTQENNIFHVLGDTFYTQRRQVVGLNNAFQGRFISEEQFEIRMNILHDQFNEAFRVVADIFRDFAQSQGLDAQQVESDILSIGAQIRYHISTGGSSDTIEEMLRNNNRTVMSFDELNSMGILLHQGVTI
ncbi:MAG: hypothetical protein FWC70_03470 [Defluviitaleaceae bacterium]|nr:hypothetical protein [Defluviitaleaceae bacterium]